MDENTLVSLPDSTDKSLGSELRVFPAGETVIRPGGDVKRLFQLMHGEVEMTSVKGGDAHAFFRKKKPDWTPIFGARYFFTGKPSSRRYVAKTESAVAIIDPLLIRRLYTERTCVTLIRELIRASDMPTDYFAEELDSRFRHYGFPGFRIEALETLLTIADGDTTGSDGEMIAAGRAFIDAEYVNFSCEMLYRLMQKRLQTCGDETMCVPPPERPRL